MKLFIVYDFFAFLSIWWFSRSPWMGSNNSCCVWGLKALTFDIYIIQESLGYRTVCLLIDLIWIKQSRVHMLLWHYFKIYLFYCIILLRFVCLLNMKTYNIGHSVGMPHACRLLTRSRPLSQYPLRKSQ